MKTIIQGLMIAFEFCGQRMSDEALLEMAKELSAYPEENVLKALKRCRHELKSIKFSDILDRLPGQHPGGEEAWALISQALTDESVSIVWTDEMRLAMGVARNLADDQVAARMAFKECYARLVRESREKLKGPRWSASLGWDVRGRDIAKQDAVLRNTLTHVTHAPGRLLS